MGAHRSSCDRLAPAHAPVGSTVHTAAAAVLIARLACNAQRRASSYILQRSGATKRCRLGGRYTPACTSFRHLTRRLVRRGHSSPRTPESGQGSHDSKHARPDGIQSRVSVRVTGLPDACQCHSLICHQSERSDRHRLERRWVSRDGSKDARCRWPGVMRSRRTTCSSR